MLRRIRSHLTYANVMVTIIAFIVLGGGAYAAFRLPKNSVRSKNIVNGQVKGVDVAEGTLKGVPPPRVLPHRHTLTGVFAVRGTATGEFQDEPDGVISFPIPLASAPGFDLGGSGGCTGSATKPTAPPGMLCLYPAQEVNVAALGVNHPDGTFGASRFGGVVVATSSAAGDKIARGTWAVTAP